MESITAKTIDLMSKFIKKTPLTHKLLSRPPFRYLHDLLSEVTVSTGFAKGLYTPEQLNSDNLKEKSSKIEYLRKIIECVSITTGVSVKANPSKIIAGLLPEETNTFLQQLAKAIIKKVDSKPAVKKILQSQSIENVDQKLTQSSEQEQDNKSISNQNSTELKDQSNELDESVADLTTSNISLNSKKDRVSNSNQSLKDESIQKVRLSNSNQSLKDESIQKPNMKKESMTEQRDSTKEQEKIEKELRSPIMERQELIQDTNQKPIRPTTARAPPPRSKAILEPEEPVFVLIKPLKQEIQDDDEFIVIEDEPLRDSVDDSEHGSLVNKLKGSSPDKRTMKTSLVKRNEEIDIIKKTLGSVLNHAQPLYKTLEYIHEDIDSMNSELEAWRKRRIQLQDELQNHKGVSKIDELQVQLKLLQVKIDGQNQTNRKVCGIILQNERIIDALISNSVKPRV